MKNDLAPISKIPPDVFSLIPEYLDGDDEDKSLITMTHVCRGWRELLIACPSLWVRLDCMNTDETRVYIERSKLTPLYLLLHIYWDMAYLEDAFLLVVPHISRLKSLTIYGGYDPLEDLAPYFSCPTPLLNKLTIDVGCDPSPVLSTMLFNGNLSSLCSLTLCGVITDLPWKNLSKLTTFELRRVPEGKTSITQLLDFFGGAHHLRDITLGDFIPTPSDAPPGRVVSLPHLKRLYIHPNPVHSILLNHLSIPAGALLTQEFEFTINESPVPDFLPKTLKNLGNIFPISCISLFLGKSCKDMRLSGPNGGLSILGRWKDWEEGAVFTLDRRILQSLSHFDLSGTQRLRVIHYKPPTLDTVSGSAPYHILSRMKDLQTLMLDQCNNLPFALALNPDRNTSKCVPCPKLEELVLCVERLDLFDIEELMSMAKERTVAGVRLPSITIFGLGELILRERVSKLKEYVTHVRYVVREELS